MESSKTEKEFGNIKSKLGGRTGSRLSGWQIAWLDIILEERSKGSKKMFSQVARISKGLADTHFNGQTYENLAAGARHNGPNGNRCLWRGQTPD